MNSFLKSIKFCDAAKIFQKNNQYGIIQRIFPLLKIQVIFEGQADNLLPWYYNTNLTVSKPKKYNFYTEFI